MNQQQIPSDDNSGFQGDRRVVIEDIPDAPGYGEDGEGISEEPERGVLMDEGDMLDEVAQERGEKTGKSRGRRAVVGLVAFLVLGGSALLAGWYLVGNGATRKAKLPVNGSSSSNAGVITEEAMTRQAIEQAGVGGPGIVFGDGSVVRPGALPPVAGSSPGGNVPVTELQPPPVNGDLSSTVKSAQATPSGEGGDAKQSSARASSVLLGRNSERSVRIAEDSKAVVDPRANSANRGTVSDDSRKDPSGVALPSFGTMLPVKTLGMLYTLRSGGLVRLELTRDVKGKGWSMARGTVLVGALRGSEYDRAYVSLVGFIDPQSGGFVKTSGDLLGSDGGAGIRGKRRKMSSGWSRALSKLGDAGLNIAGALAGSVGRRQIIISDAFGSSGARMTNEFGLISRERDGFVEVAAGSSGYVMITELPDAIQGVDALAKLSGREVEERSDSEQPRKVTGISERELAELIQSGDPDRINAALPRMTDEMRQVAEAVLGSEISR